MADYSVTYDQLDALLQGLDPNTTATPYGVKLTEVTAEFLRGKGNPIAGTLQYVLQQNQSKYISLTFGTGCSAVLESLADASYMFFDCKSLTSVDVSGMTSVTDANTMFGRCTKLTSVDASGMTSVTNASSMFFGCTNLVSVDISGMTAVTNAQSMFQNCNLMTSVDVSDMTSVTIAHSMFGSCASLTSVNASGMTSVTIASSMFIDCTNLASVDISGMTAVTDASLMFGYCSSLEEIHGWQIPLTANASYCFKGCSSLRVVYVPDTRPTPQESSWHAWDIRKDTANNQSTVTVYNPDGTSNSVSVPSAGTYTMKVTDKVDELLFSPSEGIPAATLQKMLQTKAPITARDALDPTKDNFMLWAKDRASARTNVTTDVIEAGNKLPPTSEAVQAAIGGAVPDLKEYIRNQNILSQLESITISSSSSSPTIMEYDGFLYFMMGVPSRTYVYLYINNITINVGESGRDGHNVFNCIPVNRGDSVYLSRDSTSYVSYYKLRDYTGR